jgi:hypothetical protein
LFALIEGAPFDFAAVGVGIVDMPHAQLPRDYERRRYGPSATPGGPLRTDCRIATSRRH